MDTTGERRCGNCFAKMAAGIAVCPGCGFSQERETAHRGVALPLGYLLKGKYVLGRVLGAGGFGITYLAYDLKRKKRFCVKEYYPADIAVRGQEGTVDASRLKDAYERGRDSFFREARILQSLSGCPSVVAVDSFFQMNNTAYLVMEYIEGENLKQYADRMGGKLPYNVACPLLLSLALALSEIHSRGVFHRDINPKNVLLNGAGQIKLIDFGSSKPLVGETEKSVSIRVTEGYAPPEQYSNQGEQGPWTDIYALAGTFYRLVTGVRVQPALDRRKRDEIKPLSELFPQVDSGVSQTIYKAMRLDPRERYQNIDQFIADFAGPLDTMETSPADGEIPAWKTVTNGAAPAESASIRILSGSFQGVAMALPPGRPVSLGRRESVSDIVVSSRLEVSRRHCILTFQPERGCVWVEDVSENGTFFPNGCKLHHGGTAVGEDTTISLAANGVRISIQLERRGR